MCGITGVLDIDEGWTEEWLHAVTEAMAAKLTHRGPDDSGVWVAPEARIALGHRRLAILDLSSAGHQPMHSACGRYVIAFNGEIYNYLEIRKELESLGTAPAWCGHTDTEVVLAAVSMWGEAASLKKMVGMFAFALWDREEQTLFLARDRFGEKPLYYGWMGGVFLFASELKALRAYPAWRAEIDRQALTLFLRYSYVPAPYTIYRGIRKLLPGTMLKVRSRDAMHAVSPMPYWNMRDVVEAGSRELFAGSDAEAVAELQRVLSRAAGQQMVADVPLGAFLSGGVDSSTVVALMQAQSPRPVKTFTIGFREGGYNEALYAKEVARHLGTDHTELYVTPEEAMAVIPSLPFFYDEPFADSSQIPTFLVAQLAKQEVTVSLSGDGGDEVFGGYNRYLWAPNILKKTGCLPCWLRKNIAQAVSALSSSQCDKVFAAFQAILPPAMQQTTPADKLFKLIDILAWRRPEDIYLGLVSQWQDPERIVLDADRLTVLERNHARLENAGKFSQWMMHMDTLTYLPDDILVKVDRAAMGVSLETRIPFLDHRVVEFAWRLPMEMKIKEGRSKWIVRQVLYKYVPRELIERPKSGFAVPIDSWLRGPLRSWAEDLLAPDRLQRDGFFAPEPIRKKWQEHLTGKRNWQYLLWNVLMFQAWQDFWEH